MVNNSNDYEMMKCAKGDNNDKKAISRWLIMAIRVIYIYTYTYISLISYINYGDDDNNGSNVCYWIVITVVSIMSENKYLSFVEFVNEVQDCASH